MALSRGLITNTPREAAARGCRARLSHLISISLAWSLLSLARWRSRVALAARTTCAQSTRAHSPAKSRCKLRKRSRIRCHLWVAGASAPTCTLPLHSGTRSHSAAAFPSHAIAACSHDEHRSAQQVEDGHHLQRDADGLQSCCHRATSCRMLGMVVAGKPLDARVASPPVAMRARTLNLPLSRSQEGERSDGHHRATQGQPHAAASRGTD